MDTPYHKGAHRGKERSHRHGAKTFRRGRAIAFLDMMNLKRATIKQQLNEPEFTSIHSVLVGELKAIDMIINEFINLFEIQESEITVNETVEVSEEPVKKGVENDERNE
nr:hypothetical protein [Sporosarcina obsidiansis]